MTSTITPSTGSKHRRRFISVLKKLCLAPDTENRAMVSMYHGLVPGARNVWSYWTDHIMEQAEKFNFTKTAIFTVDGRIDSFSHGDFIPSRREIQRLNQLFENNNQSDATDDDDVMLSYHDCTYIVRTFDDVISSRHVVAFNGSRYLLVSKSQSMYVAVLMNSNRQRSDQLQNALHWLDRLTRKLIERGF